MSPRAWSLAIVLLSCVIPAQGQPPASSPPDCAPFEINGAGTIPAPPGAENATQVRIVSAQGQPVSGLEFTLVGGSWSLSPEKFEQINALKNTPGRTGLSVVWLRDGTLVLAKRFLLPGEDRQSVCASPLVPPPGAPTPAVPANPSGTNLDALDAGACRPHLATFEGQIRSRLGSNRYTVIIFKPDGTVCITSKPYGAAGDLIYTAVLVDSRTQPPGPSIEFTKCEAPSVSPNNPEGETLASRSQLAGDQRLFEFSPRQCFGTAAEMKIKNRVSIDAGAPKEINTTYTLSMLNRYRFTLQVGVLGTPQHSRSFGLRKDGNDMRIFDKGPVDEGPEYVATIVLYGLPRYFGVGRPKGGDPTSGERDSIKGYFGREIFNEDRFADRLGFVLGADLNKPGDRVVAGLSFELGYGINLIGVYEYAKLKELVGVSEDDIFTGTVEQIPTRDDWSGKWVGGVSMDLRYFARLIKRATS